MPSTNSLPVNEVFTSINGEPPLWGYPSTFLRFYGCNLRCVWCDTKYSYDTGDYTLRDIDSIAKWVADVSKQKGIRVLVITGGEPTMYITQVYALYKKLYNRFEAFVIETNGTVRIPEEIQKALNSDYSKVYWAVSPKLRSSGVNYRYANNEYSPDRTIFKFVTSKLPEDLDEILQDYAVLLRDYPVYVTTSDLNMFTRLFDLVSQRYTMFKAYLQIHVVAHGRERGY